MFRWKVIDSILGWDEDQDLDTRSRKVSQGEEPEEKNLIKTFEIPASTANVFKN